MKNDRSERAKIVRGPQNAKTGPSLKWRVLIVILGAAALIVGIVTLLFYFTDASLFIRTGTPQYVFSTADGGFMHKTLAGDVKFTVKGVSLSDSYTSSASYEDYLSCFKDISAMNANTVYVENVCAPDFYRALRDHNASASAALYLVQGVDADDEDYKRIEDAWDDGLGNILISQGKLAIDAVHGCRPALGYSYDVADYVVGFAVGRDWDSDLVVYTNMMHADKAGKYNGTYIQVWDTSQAFETLMARTVDKLFAYETGKYGFQSPIGLRNGMNTDCLAHNNEWSPGLKENLTSVNTVHLAEKDTVKAGYFAAYHAENATMQFLSYDPEYTGYTDDEGNADPFLCYVSKLAKFHDMPVLITGVSASSARGISGIDEVTGRNRGGGEDSQAETISSLVKDVLNSGCAGACVSTYIDDLTAKAWNDYGSLASGAWKDSQDTEQYTGLISLSPPSPCTVDGDLAEWASTATCVSAQGKGLKYMYDAEYLYLCVEGAGAGDTCYIPLDVTPVSGSKKMGALSFGFDADFVVLLNGPSRSRMLVQQYYNELLSRKGSEVWSQDTISSPPAKDSSVFMDILQYCRAAMFDKEGEIVAAETRTAGLFKDGADIAFAEDGAELRIPWSLLNFRDPSKALIWADFYSPDKEDMSIDGITAGLAKADGTFETGKLGLSGWKSGSFKTYKKSAYDALATLFTDYK